MGGGCLVSIRPFFFLVFFFSSSLLYSTLVPPPPPARAQPPPRATGAPFMNIRYPTKNTYTHHTELMNLALIYILIISILFRVRIYNHSSSVPLPTGTLSRRHRNKGAVSLFLILILRENAHYILMAGGLLLGMGIYVVPCRQCLERTRLPPLDA